MFKVNDSLSFFNNERYQAQTDSVMYKYKYYICKCVSAYFNIIKNKMLSKTHPNEKKGIHFRLNYFSKTSKIHMKIPILVSLN